MRFAGVDIPQALIEAHADGGVVFFVGAGASMFPPTRLPSFGELTANVAALAGVMAPTQNDLKVPDVFLGRIDAPPRIDVHHLVATEIAKARRRNGVHDAVATLAVAGGTPRIVTTNYDDFLRRALKANGVNPVIHEAPALPLGADFEGIVHIHGRLGQPSRRLVITDSDFGFAYITRGWAPSFLRELFAKFVVCFVGYSHEDRMMEYLAKGLSSDTRPRYIFTDTNGSDEHWARLGINPIYFPGQRYDVMKEALIRWGKWARDTPYDRAERVRSLAADTPPADPEDQDFLTAALTDRVLATEVCRIATSPSWVEWLLGRPAMRAMLEGKRGQDLSSACVLAEWVVERGTADEHCYERVFAALAGRSTGAPPLLVGAMLQRIRDASVDKSLRSRWLRWALAGAASPDLDFELDMLWASGTDLTSDEALLVLTHLLDRWTSPGVGILSTIREAEPRPEGWAFREGVGHHLVLSGQHLFQLLEFLGHFFGHGHRLVVADQRFDPWSFRRSSISSHEQDADGRDDVVDALIDLARDSLAKAFVEERVAAQAVRALWLRSSVALLRRIAVNSLALARDLAAEPRIAQVWELDLLFDVAAHHEIYELVQICVREISDDGVADLVKMIELGPNDRAVGALTESEAESIDWRVYNLLEWVMSCRPTTNPPARLAQIKALHPDWEPREHADFTHYSWSGVSSIEDEHPWTPDSFHEMLGADVGATVAALERRLGDEPDEFWSGAQHMVENVVTGWSDDGITLWDATVRSDLRGAVVRGWSRAPMSSGHLKRIEQRLRNSDLEGFASAVPSLLRPWTDDAAVRDRWVSRPAGRQLARRVFTLLKDSTSGMTGADPYTASINSPIGTLAEFWIGVASHEARTGVYPGGRLSVGTRAALKQLIRESATPALAESPLLRQLVFFMRADHEWTSEHLLPLLDPARSPWDEVDRRWRVLLRAQVSEELLDAGVRDWLLGVASRAVGETELSTAAAQMAAQIAVHSTMDDDERLGWVARFVAVVDDATAARWTRQVATALSSLDGDARSSLWSRWMRRYVQQRVAGAPRRIAPEELTALLDWAFVLREIADVEEAVRLIISADTGLAPNAYLRSTNYLEDEGVLRSFPNLWARLLAGVLAHTDSLESHTCRQLDAITAELRAVGADSQVCDEIARALYNLGPR
ncbi:MAG: SIR2 family protein [Humibacter sp.]